MSFIFILRELEGPTLLVTSCESPSAVLTGGKPGRKGAGCSSLESGGWSCREESEGTSCREIRSGPQDRLPLPTCCHPCRPLPPEAQWIIPPWLPPLPHQTIQDDLSLGGELFMGPHFQSVQFCKYPRTQAVGGLKKTRSCFVWGLHRGPPVVPSPICLGGLGTVSGGPNWTF